MYVCFYNGFTSIISLLIVKNMFVWTVRLFFNDFVSSFRSRCKVFVRGNFFCSLVHRLLVSSVLMFSGISSMGNRKS